MKIIHCADLHLDSRMNTHLDSRRARERKAELLRTFLRMVEYAVAEEVRAIIIAGDMFDTVSISAGSRNAVYDAIVHHPEIDFYYLKGNHDSDGFLEELESQPANLKTFTDSWTSYDLEETGRVVLSGLELSARNSMSAGSSLVLATDVVNIVTLHGQVADSGSRDKAEIINLTALKNKGIDYLALGHIHSYRQERLDARGVWCYPGCLEGRGFDETGKHGFVLLEVDEEKRTVKSEFIPFAYRELVLRQVDVSGCITSQDAIHRIDDSLATAPVEQKDMVRIELTGEVDIAADFDTAYIGKCYEDSYYFVKAVDNTRLHVDYSDYMLDESLKGEFVRQVMAASDIAEEDKPLVIRHGLRAIAGEEILEVRA